MPDTTPFETLTLARLLAGQGDVSGASRVLRGILARDPADAAAGALLSQLTQGRDGAPLREDAPPEIEPPVAATASELAAAFRQALGGGGDAHGDTVRNRLERWAARVARNRGLHDAR